MKKIIFIFITSTLLCIEAFAGVSVMPVQLFIVNPEKQKSTTLTLESVDESEKRIFEVKAFKWTQDERGENILEPDNNIMINPKNFILQPNKKQTIRVGFIQPPSALLANKQEEAWRIIVDEIPPVREYKEGELQDASIYKTNIDDIITDCLHRLNEWHKGLYTELNEIVPRDIQFHRELSSLLNRYSKENGSNTPDFLLASYLTGCLHTFNSIVSAREEWCGMIEKRKEKDITGETQIRE